MGHLHQGFRAGFDSLYGSWLRELELQLRLSEVEEGSSFRINFQEVIQIASVVL